MKQQSRGQVGQVRRSALATFMTSSAPDSLQTAVLSILELVKHYSCLDEVVVCREQPDIHDRIMALTPVGYDYIRLLRDEQPVLRRHSRRYVGAALRDVRRAKGGTLTTCDFPPGHYVAALANIYWGGVDVWNEAAPGRQQKPKNFWCNRSNQIEALRTFAERFPDASITTKTLNDAGLHALATRLNSAKLDELVIEAGLRRNLKYRPRGFWTKAETIAAYARECEKVGIPLTNPMLADMGGIGMIIRSNAQTLFGRFHLFRRQVAELYPWLKPNAPCKTGDGTELDSWQEVAVYEKLRRALLPEIRIVPHVRLEGLSRCATDFLIGGAVYVEVLMLGLAQIAEPRGSTEQSYAKKWFRKSQWYTSTKSALVIIEPKDISDSERMAAKVGEVSRLLGLSARCHVTETDCTIQNQPAMLRPKDYWSFDKLCQIVAQVALDVGAFPTHAQLRAAGYASAPTMLNRYGRHRVSAAIDVPLRNQKAIWTRELVVQQLAACVREHGCLPTVGELKGSGRGRLASAWIRFTNGATNGIAPDVELICGTAISNRRAAPHSYETQAQLAEFLRPICDKLGKFPTRAECREAELSPTVWSTVSLRYGVREMAAMMQVRYEGPRRKRTLLSPAKGLPLFHDVDPGCRPKSKLRRRR